MTREEAIYLLNNLRSVAEGKEDEAIDMAIEALSAEPSDLISRADAIESVEGLTKYMEKLVEGVEKFPEAHTKNYKHDMEQQIMGVAHASQVILELPSADAVSREAWNDVTEEYVNTVGAILAVISAPSCLKEVDDMVSNINTSVVRCKDCKHNHYDGDTIFCMMLSGGHHGHTIQMVSEDFFCKYGERREP